MQEVKQFKIRCSAIGQIMAGTFGLTASQQEKLEELEARHANPIRLDMPEGKAKKLTQLLARQAEFEAGNTKKALTAKMQTELADLEHLRDNPQYKYLTDKQQEEMRQLQHLRDNPELPTGAKSYCKRWLIAQVTGKRKMVTTKSMAKGIIVEKESLKRIAKVVGRFMLKNEEHFEDDYMTGTPDVKLSDLIVDAKNSETADSFPMYESECPSTDYPWQMQGYMHLTGRPKAIIAYCLTNTPYHLVEKQARFAASLLTTDEMSMHEKDELFDSMLEEYEKNLTYDDVDDHLRVKLFHIDRDDAAIAQIIERVKACRVYISSLLKTQNQCQTSQSIR